MECLLIGGFYGLFITKFSLNGKSQRTKYYKHNIVNVHDFPRVIQYKIIIKIKVSLFR